MYFYFLSLFILFLLLFQLLERRAFAFSSFYVHVFSGDNLQDDVFKSVQGILLKM